jgi:hypothetical protein
MTPLAVISDRWIVRIVLSNKSLFGLDEIMNSLVAQG